MSHGLLLIFSYEPMDDLIYVLSRLKDVHGNILIGGLKDLVKPLTAEEEKLYDNIDLDLVRRGNDVIGKFRTS